MKNFKRFVYEMLVKYYGFCVCSYVESFEMAKLDSDRRGCEYCDKHIAKYLAKEEKYKAKLEAL